MTTPYRHLIDWAAGACLPLAGPLDTVDGPLRAMIGPARLVSLGEGLHGAHEPIEFRNALFAWLVGQLGFRAIALESALSSGLAIDTFVQGGPGDADQVVARGISSGLHVFPQQARLVRWMRAFNERCAAGDRLSFHGIDTSPLADALELALARIDGPAAGALRERVQPLRSGFEVDRMSPEPRGYTALDGAQREALGACVAELATRVEAAAPVLARALRQAELYLRQFPPGWSAAQGSAGIWGSVAASDLGKAVNVEQLLRQQERVLLFSHLGHASTLPVSIRLGADTVALPEMMGAHLRRRCGSGELLTIGHLLADNQCQPAVGIAPADSLEGRLATLGHEAFLLDLRQAPPEALAELQVAPHPLHGQLPVHQLSPGLGIDIIYFTRRATPAL
ncbi:erythromycin esterase family protein [Roseateles sp.]|uniref:erythromycin esterase family protein n=1 Tax=Roseateles sp. TaxID=1971397 RepID=UPI0039E77544